MPESGSDPLLFQESAEAMLRIGAAVTYEDFAQGVVGFLRQTMEFDALDIRLSIFDRETDSARAAVSLPGAKPLPALDPEARKVRRQLAPAFHYMENNPGTQVYLGVGHTLPAAKELEQSRFYKDFMGPEGWRDYLGMAFWNETGRDGWIFVNRRNDQPLFARHDVELFQRVYPYFAGALHRLQLLADERARRADLEDSLLDLPIATFVLDWQLAVVQANRAAYRLCASWHHGADHLQVYKLPNRIEVPASIAATCRELRELWKDVTNAPVTTTRRVVPHPSRPELQATVTVLRPNALRLGRPSFLVRITEVMHYAGDSIRVHDQVQARLTPAERIIASRLARGASNKEIALALGKSTATVKNQIHAMLEKTGASNRSQLVAMLHR